jgi:glycosyltransferase involved in cell wall biosynthesis
VLITSFNQKDYLREAVESVLAQTRPADQIVVADDASSDGSQDLIREYEERHSGIVEGVFNPKNLGIRRNRNSGLEQIRTDYVAVLDGDDIYLPRNLERQMEALADNPRSVFCHTNIFFMTADGTRFLIRHRKPALSGPAFPRVVAHIGLMRSMVMRTEAVREVGMFDVRFPMHDGFLLTIRLAQLGELAYVFEPLMAKREHANSDQRAHGYRKRLNYRRDLWDLIRPMLDGQPESEIRFVSRQYARALLAIELQMHLEEKNLPGAYAAVLRTAVQDPRTAGLALKTLSRLRRGRK